MPKRQSTKTIPTPEMQGDDSWIKVRPPTYKEAKKQRKLIREIEFRREAIEGAGGDIVKEHEIEDELEQNGLEAMASFFVEWNWVDDDENPLEQPFNNPAAFEQCDAFEIKYLGKVMQDLMGSEDEKKD